MKKRIYLCCAAFVSLAIVFSLVSYISFRNATTIAKSNKVKQNTVASYVSDKPVSEKLVSDIPVSDKPVSVDTGTDDRINKNTKFTIQYYDLADSVYTDHVVQLPNKYVGLSRPELEQALCNYTKQCSTEEKEKGLLYITVVSFSKDSVTVRKVYDNKNNYKYYISVKDGYVIVYDNDKTTVADETGIDYNSLSEKQKQEVDQGVYIDDLSELYSVLESYTS